MNSPCEKNTWHIAGIGAIGTLIASKFCESSIKTKLLLKNKSQLNGYKHHGLSLTIDDNTTCFNPPAHSICNLSNQPINQLIVCCKSHSVLPLLLQLKQNLTPDSLIILIHNGLGVVEDIQKNLPDIRIITGITTHGAYLEKPFAARAFITGTLQLGAVRGKFTSSEIDTVINAFSAVNLSFHWQDNIQPVIWQKFAINCSINLLTVLYQCKNGQLLNYMPSLHSITTEIAIVLSAYGFNITPSALLDTTINCLKDTQENYSSMYKDIHHNRKTELNYLNHQLSVLATNKKISTPYNNRLLAHFYQTYPDRL